METTVLVGLFASCAAIGALSGVRHQHLSTLVRTKAEQYERVKAEKSILFQKLREDRRAKKLTEAELNKKNSEVSERYDSQLENIRKQIRKFLDRNKRITLCVFANVFGASAFGLLCLPPIAYTWTSLVPLYIGVLAIIIGLVIIAWEFWDSQDTLNLELERVGLN